MNANQTASEFLQRVKPTCLSLSNVARLATTPMYRYLERGSSFSKLINPSLDCLIGNIDAAIDEQFLHPLGRTQIPNIVKGEVFVLPKFVKI